jgi:glutathione-independent formaldehyde dehydrogenase
MATNRGVVYIGPGKVEVQGIDYPQFVAPNGKEIDHGVILRIVSTNICGSDQHMVRGRTTAPAGLVLGHEITGEIIEKGRGVEFFEIGDLVSVPFNVACGRCRNCREQKTGICSNVNPARAGGAYGYVDMGGWVGGQAEWVMVPYADFNLLKFPDKAQAMEKIRDLTCLSDILPTGYHGAVSAGVGPGTTVYIAGAYWRQEYSSVKLCHPRLLRSRAKQISEFRALLDIACRELALGDDLQAVLSRVR